MASSDRLVTAKASPNHARIGRQFSYELLQRSHAWIGHVDSGSGDAGRGKIVSQRGVSPQANTPEAGAHSGYGLARY